jgi:hypothetical protein
MMKFPIAWLLGSTVLLLCRNVDIVVLAAKDIKIIDRTPVAPGNNNKIVGGTPVAPGDYPYHCVSVLPDETFCGCR